jgi:NAD(P)-dependent dehydrogenase (short-subunit alcohol dehydrogenase family)
MDLKGKACLITGGTKGIGAATAVEFARLGADVVITGRHHDDEAKRTIDAAQKLGRRCELLIGDIGKKGEATRYVTETIAKLGGIDVLVHSAGGPVNGGLLDLTEDAWNAAFDVHIHPIFYLCRAAIPYMRKKKEGSIVLLSSSAGKRAIKSNIAYQTVKGALPQMTRALAFEFSDDNIRVNCVAPGVIRTAFHQHMTEEVRQNNLKNRIPLHREGTIEQVASLIREMATNDYVTGETFSIDGGLTMRIC